jgi:spore maturation protein B
MKLLGYLSDLVIPLSMLVILINGLSSGRNIYEDFLEGAEEGVKTVGKLLPTLIGLMSAVGVLRASGFLDFLGGIFGGLTAKIGIPGELLPLSLVRMISSSAATGLLLDLFKEYGTDSTVGWMAALMMGATESVFYCMSVYFGSVHIRRSSYTLPGALLASLAGLLAAVGVVHFFQIIPALRFS